MNFQPPADLFIRAACTLIIFMVVTLEVYLPSGIIEVLIVAATVILHAKSPFITHYHLSCLLCFLFQDR